MSQIISTIYKLLEYNFLWNCLELRDEIYLTIQMRIFKNVKFRHTMCLKFGDRFFISPIMLGIEQKGSMSSTIKENVTVYLS